MTWPNLMLLREGLGGRDVEIEMADVSVNSVKASEVSDEMVALYLLASIAANESGAAVNIKDGVPIISGKDKEWLLTNYVDCLRSIIRREAKI